MAYRMAVGSGDGRMVDQHFGRAERFYIYMVEDDGSRALIDIRENGAEREEGEHHSGELNRTIELIGDCAKVLAMQIGPGAVQALKQRGIAAFSAPGPVEDMLDKLIAFETRRSSRSFSVRETE